MVTFIHSLLKLLSTHTEIIKVILQTFLSVEANFSPLIYSKTTYGAHMVHTQGTWNSVKGNISLPGQ